MRLRYIVFIVSAFMATVTAMAQHADRYASHSVLASGRWVKIRVPQTGLYQLTDDLLMQAGFSSPERVQVWGYGGALQPDVLGDKYLRQTDDLKQVATYYDGGRRLFYAVGPVNWKSTTNDARERNFYSSYGYYFLTDTSDEPALEQADSAAFVKTFYPSPTHYHSLSETDDFAWYHGGRELFRKEELAVGDTYTCELPAYSETGSLTISMVFNKKFAANVYLNGVLLSTITPTTSVISNSTGRLVDSWAKAGVCTWKLNANGQLKPTNRVTIEHVAVEGVTNVRLRMDFVAVNSTRPRPMCSLSREALPEPELVGVVKPQDRHADEWADMVIIVPASGKLLQQAQRLKKQHEQADGLRVNIVAADELYNEFSSGTPDGNAYRRYLKMLYDRASSPDERPRYLLLFGDGAWDNRMLISDWKSSSPDDYLLCYESANSVSETKCYVSDDYFGLMADGKGKDMLRSDLIDVAVGRFPVLTDEQAKVMVDKVIAYQSNTDAGAWQNLLCFMGDDGDQNMHMNDAEMVVKELTDNYSGYQIQKIYWDSYQRRVSVAGNRYPDVERVVKENMKNGALVMNYTGHGGADYISKSYVLKRAEFDTIATTRLPLWVTASCDIVPFDGVNRTFGEDAVLSARGGAVAFFGTARTVYAFYNQYMNRCFMRHLLGSTNGRRNTIGEAAMLAKNELMTTGDDRTENKFQYVLIGDPALTLAAPTLSAVIETINGQAVDSDKPVEVPAGSRLTVTGSIPDDPSFSGKLTATVFDAEQVVTGRMNNKSETDTAIVFRDYPHIIYTGSTSVSGGKFSFTFTVSRDISYTDANAKIVLYAVSDDLKTSAHGEEHRLKLVEGSQQDEEGVGPQLTCYLNEEGFVSGDEVEQKPLFVAYLYDEDGINYTGSSLGHDLELVIDGKTAYTYILNSFFQSLSGDAREGMVAYRLPELTYGNHQLRFRAWDMLNNSESVTLRFSIVNVMGIDDLTGDGDGSLSPTAQVFDTAGRRLGSSMPRGNGLFIYRTADGQVKKMMGRRQ